MEIITAMLYSFLQKTRKVMNKGMLILLMKIFILFQKQLIGMKAKEAAQLQVNPLLLLVGI